LLTGSALAWFAPLLEKQSELLEDFGKLVKEFEATFGDADKQIASDLDWGEAALVDQFRTRLRDDRSRDSGSERHQTLAPSNLASSVTEPMQIDAVDISHCPLERRNKNVKIVTLVNSGVSACFLDTTFAQEYNIPIYKKELPFSVEVIDGRKIFSGNVTHEMGPLLVCLQDHYEKMSFNLISSPHYPIILGLPWLDLHNPTINWRERSIIFFDPMCKEHH
ncbi:34747_t:CDS:2, partial [Racocetra persica]